MRVSNVRDKLNAIFASAVRVGTFFALSICLALSLTFVVAHWGIRPLFVLQVKGYFPLLLLSIAVAAFVIWKLGINYSRLTISDKFLWWSIRASTSVVALCGLLLILVGNGRFQYQSDSKIILTLVSAETTKSDYLAAFPFQSSLVYLLRVLAHLFGNGNLLPFYFLNLVALVVSVYFLQKITLNLSSSNQATLFTSLFCLLFSPLVMYVPMVYGDLIGISLEILSLYFATNYIKLKKKRTLFFMFISLVGMLWMKSSLLLVVVGLVIFGIFQFLKRGKFELLLLGLLVLLSFELINSSFVARFDSENQIVRTQKVPALTWLAMGLQSGTYSSRQNNIDDVTSEKSLDDVKLVPGAWNGFTGAFSDAGAVSKEMDVFVAQNYASSALAKSIKTFVKHPYFAVRFFALKLAYQWGDSSFWANNVGENDKAVIGPYVYLPLTGRATDFMFKTFGMAWVLRVGIDKVLSVIIYLFALVGLILEIRQKRMQQTEMDELKLLLHLLFLGGFIFYAFWESGGRMALPFYLLLFPLSSIGLHEFFEMCQRKRRLGRQK
jgi:hypothetical protein